MFSLNLKLVLLSLLIIFLDSRHLLPLKNEIAAFSLPFEVGFGDLARSSADGVKFFIFLSNLERENTGLKQTVEDLESNLTKLKDVERENEILKAQLKINNIPESARVVLARVS